MQVMRTQFPLPAARALLREPSAGIPGTVPWVEDQAERLPGVRRAEVLPSGRAVVHLVLVLSWWMPAPLARLLVARRVSAHVHERALLLEVAP
jgi:hypothetical protein